MNLSQSDLHPSAFQNTNYNSNDTQNIKTLIDISNLQNTNTNTNLGDLTTLKSPGSYNFTVDDKQLSPYNTQFLFRNLYGETPLTFLFFSGENTNNLQNIIKMLVYKQMKYVIDNQSITDLQIIMRSIFLSFHQHPPLIDEKMSENQKVELLKIYTNEVSRLNNLVINDIVPRVCSGLQQHLDYLKDASTPIKPIPRSQNTSNAGTRNYRSTLNVLTGSAL